MLKPAPMARYRRDVKRLRQAGANLSKLNELLALLVNETPLPAHYKDHPLEGDLHKWRDAHIEDDWGLIYRVIGQRLLLGRTGTHANVFRANKRRQR